MTWTPVLGSLAKPKFPLKRVSRPTLSSASWKDGLPLINRNGFAYLAEIDVGGQTLEVILDTGSSDLWVVSDICTGSDCSGVTRYHDTASLNLSSSSFQLKYLAGNVTGIIGAETITLGRFQIASQAFALANNTEGLNLAGVGHSGILGLAFPIEASIPATAGQPILANIFSHFNETERFFAVQLGRDPYSSSFSVGVLDPTTNHTPADFFYSDVFPLTGTTYDYWKLRLHALTLDNATLPLRSSKVSGARSAIAVLDTGTTLILGPSTDVASFWNNVGGARLKEGTWQVRCDRAVSVGLEFGDDELRKTIWLDPADVNWLGGGQDGDFCMGGIQANDHVNSGDWLLGDTFLRNVYALHHGPIGVHPPRIGFLDTTDPVAALKAFRAERGPDTLSPVQANFIDARPWRTHMSATTTCSLALIAGLVFGTSTVLTLLTVNKAKGRFLFQAKDTIQGRYYRTD